MGGDFSAHFGRGAAHRPLAAPAPGGIPLPLRRALLDRGHPAHAADERAGRAGSGRLTTWRGAG